ERPVIVVEEMVIEHGICFDVRTDVDEALDLLGPTVAGDDCASSVRRDRMFDVLILMKSDSHVDSFTRQDMRLSSYDSLKAARLQVRCRHHDTLCPLDARNFKMLEPLHQHRECFSTEICRCQNDIQRPYTTQEKIEALCLQVPCGPFEAITNQVTDQ